MGSPSSDADSTLTCAMVCTYIHLMVDRKALKAYFDSEIFRVFAEPVRYNIFRFLAEEGPCDVSSIARGFSQDRSVISRHLQTLERAGVVQSEKVSRQVIYSVSGEAMIARMEENLAVLKKIISTCCK